MKIITKEQAKESMEPWSNWEWQQRYAIQDIRDCAQYFTQIDRKFFDDLYAQSGKRLRFRITPYMLSQIPQGITQAELERNPWFLQFFPQGEIYTEGADAYDGTDNWEKSSEFPTSCLHHKYTNRVLVRLRECLASCNFCFEALGVLERSPSTSKTFKWDDWQNSLEYIAQNPDIEEVILSGGEPLLLSDSKLECMLRDINEIKGKDGRPKVKFKRIHTRVLTHNPFRVLGAHDFARMVSQYRVNEIALHIAHPCEITKEFIEAVKAIRGCGGDSQTFNDDNSMITRIPSYTLDSYEECKRAYSGMYVPMLVAQTPLLKGFNDSTEILWELFGKLYEHNIKPYYLLHAMPHIPYGNKQRTSVRKGAELMRALKRHKSNIALPEYVIVHKEGKQTVPLEENGTPEFQYTHDDRGNPVIRFKNWKGNWETYPDGRN
jgi:lysine 2,3-aminomutase